MTLPTDDSDGTERDAYAPQLEPTFDAARLAELSPPGYALERELGRGTSGVVFLARQLGLNRVVALKTLLSAELADDEARERLRREAEAVAAIRHVNVVEVYDSGRHRGQPFFAMELVTGGSLAQRVRERALPAGEAVWYVLQAARGLAEAHRAGVVHRDVKPANVLLTPEGVAKVTDFGLAKLSGFQDTLTATDAALGTPAYMSPEQAAGHTARVGPAADVYALGATLYRLVAGRPPFQAHNALATISLVLHEDPLPPSALVPGLPRDLDTLVLKCLEKAPEARYADAGELADELGRLARGEPIVARPVGPLERAWKWARRHPSESRPLALIFVASVLLGLLGLRYRADMLEAEGRDRAAAAALERAEGAAEAGRLLAEAREGFRLLGQARARRFDPRPGWTWDTLADLAALAKLSPDAEAAAEARDIAAAALLSPDAREAGRFPMPDAGQYAYPTHVAFHPTRPLAAVARFGFTAPYFVLKAWLFDPRDPAAPPVELRAPFDVFNPTPNGKKESSCDLRFSPDGRHLVLTTRGGRLHRWDVDAPARGPQSMTLGTRAHGLAFGPPGRLYASGADAVRAIDTDAWALLPNAATGRAASTVSYAPDADRLAVEGGGLLRWLDPHDLTEVAPAVPAATVANFGPDGRTGYYGEADAVRVVDALSGRDSGALEPADGDSGRPGAPVVSPDGALVAVPRDGSQAVRLLAADTGRPVAEISVPERAGAPPPVAFSPDGALLAVGAARDVRLFEVRRGAGRPLGQRPWPAAGLEADAAGRTLLTLSRAAAPDWQSEVLEASLWPAAGAPGRPARSRSAEQWPSGSGRLALQPGGPWAALQGDRQVHLWNVRTGQRLRLPRTGLPRLAFAPGGRLWATGDRLEGLDPPDFRVRVSYDSLLRRAENVGTATHVAAGTAGVLAGGLGGRALWLRPDGKLLASWQAGESPVSALALSPDESLALVGHESGEAGLFRLPTGERLAAWRAHDRRVADAAWLGPHDLATVGGGRTLHLWAWGGPPADAPVRVLRAPTDRPVARLAPIAGGGLAVLPERARGLRVLDLPALEASLARLGFPAPVPAGPPREPGPALEAPPERAPAAGMRADYSLVVNRRPADLAPVASLAAVAPGTPHPDHNPAWFVAAYRGWLRAPVAGRYTLLVEADDSAAVWLDGLPRPHAPRHEFEVDLTAGPHRLRIDHLQTEGASHLRLSWKRPGDAALAPPGDALTPDRPLDAPLAAATLSQPPPDR